MYQPSKPLKPIGQVANNIPNGCPLAEENASAAADPPPTTIPINNPSGTDR